MTSVIAGQSITLLSQWYASVGGPLADLDATPSIRITNIATSAVAVATTTVGVTHPSVGAYGYVWSTALALAPGDYLVVWSGLRAGNPVSYSETVTVQTPLGTRSYATVQQFDSYPGTTVTADTESRLVEATTLLDARVLRTAWYDADDGGNPTDPLVQVAFARAVCAQVRWWDELGGSTTGASGSGYTSVSIGGVSLSRGASSATGSDAPEQQVAPTVWDELRHPLLETRLRMGAVFQR